MATKNISAEGGTFTANVSFNPSSCDSGTVDFVSQDSWIQVNGNTFTVSKNTSAQRTGYISVKYNGSECTQHKITVEQAGIDCGCGTIIVDGSISITIPTGGVAGGVEIGQYTKQTSECSDSDIIGTLKNGNTTYNLTFSSNKIYLQDGQSIPQNPDSEGRPFAFKLYYKNDECTAFSNTYTQPGTGCACGSLESVSFDTIPTAGVAANTTIGHFSAGDCASHFTFVNSTLDLTKDGTDIITNNGIESNPAGETFPVEILYDGSPCSSTAITQEGTGCGCGTLHNVTFNNIPSDGVKVSDNYVIGTYNTDNNACQYTFIEVNNKFTMAGNNSTGNIIVTSEIPENTGYAPIPYTVVAKYDNSECVRSGITQEGGLKCDCESIGLMITLTKRTFPKSGTTQWPDEGYGVGWVLVATGNTYGCGSLSAVSESSLLESPGVVVQDNGDNTYNFYIKVLPSNTSGDETAGLKVYFKKNQEEQFDCYETVYVTQTTDYCSCGEMPAIKYDYSKPVTNGMEIEISQNKNDLVFSMVDIYNPLQCYDIEISTQETWIPLESSKYGNVTTYYSEYLHARPEANPGDIRNGTVVIRCYVDREGIPTSGNYTHGTGGRLCGEYTINIKQAAYVGCSCENSGFDNFDLWPHRNPHQLTVDSCEHENMNFPFTLDCGTLEFEAKDGALPNWITVSIDNENKIMYLNISKNENTERSTAILFYPRIDGVDCKDNVFEMDVTQEELICTDCDVVKDKINAFNNYQWGCTELNEYVIGSYPDSECTCGTISAVTCDENGNEIQNPDVTGMTTYQASSAYNLKALFTRNTTDADRHFYFKIFVVDGNGNRIPDNNCYKTSHIVQCSNKEVCDCSSYRYANVSQVGYNSVITAGDGDCKVGKLTLTKESEEALTDCLLISVISTHTEITNAWLDENNEINITVISELVDDESHPAAVNVNIFNTNEIDPETGEPKKCPYGLQPIELTILPNKSPNDT